MVAERDASHPGMIVAVDYHSHLLPTVEFAVRLANAQRLAVHGLYIEDPALTVVSTLPFSQEVTLLGARSRALDEQYLRRTQEGFSRRFRELLSERAERASLRYSFGRAEGRQQALDLGAGSHSSYVVLGQPGLPRNPDRDSLRVLLVGVATEAVLPVLECLMLEDRGRSLELCLLNGSGKEEDHKRLRQFVSAHPGSRFWRETREQLARTLRKASQQPDLVISSRKCEPRMLKLILELATCPVILAQDHHSKV